MAWFSISHFSKHDKVTNKILTPDLNYKLGVYFLALK
jgi:hypothetical protein